MVARKALRKSFYEKARRTLKSVERPVLAKMDVKTMVVKEQKRKTTKASPKERGYEQVVD